MSFRQQIRNLEADNVNLRRLNSNAYYTFVLLAHGLVALEPHVRLRETGTLVIGRDGKETVPGLAEWGSLLDWARAFVKKADLSAADQAGLRAQLPMLTLAARADENNRPVPLTPRAPKVEPAHG